MLSLPIHATQVRGVTAQALQVATNDSLFFETRCLAHSENKVIHYCSPLLKLYWLVDCQQGNNFNLSLMAKHDYQRNYRNIHTRYKI